MQRPNRSAHAPAGAAFFLFLGLAILPISLGAAGVQVSFTPRLAAAMDAWQQVAEVFGASYHPAPTQELGVVREPDRDPSGAIEGSVCPRSSEFACTRKAAERPETALYVSDANALKSARVRPALPRSGSRRSLPSNQVAQDLAKAIKLSLEVPARTIGELGALKLATLKREELLKRVDKQVFHRTFEPIGETRNLPGSKTLRVLVRLKLATAGFSAKTAEVKVFSAMASTRRHECERAMLMNMLPASPDHSEF